MGSDAWEIREGKCVDANTESSRIRARVLFIPQSRNRRIDNGRPDFRATKVAIVADSDTVVGDLNVPTKASVLSEVGAYLTCRHVSDRAYSSMNGVLVKTEGKLLRFANAALACVRNRVLSVAPACLNLRHTLLTGSPTVAAVGS